MYFQIYTEGNQYRWRLRAANHEIIAHGESYYNERDCLYAIGLVMATNDQTPIYRA